MPTYEYECNKGCRFEAQQSILEDPLERCTKALCPRGQGGVKVQRLISAANFILKGGGWYADGYSSSNGGSGSAESKTSSSASSPSSSSSSSSSGKSGSGSSDSGSSAAAD